MTSSILISLFSLFGNLFSYIRSPVLETQFSYLSFVYFFFFCSNFRKIYSPLFSNAFIEFLWVCIHSCPTLCNPIDLARQALLSMGFPRQEYWSGLPFLLQGIFPTLGSNPGLLCLLHCRRFFTAWAFREAPNFYLYYPFSNFQEVLSAPQMLLFLMPYSFWWLYILVLTLLIRGYLMFSSTCTVSLFSRLPFSIHFGLCNSCERHPQCLGNVDCLLLFKMGGGGGEYGSWRAEWKAWTCKGFVTRRSTVCSSGAVWLEDAHISSVPSLSRVRLFATPRTAACQASLSITNSCFSLKNLKILGVQISQTGLFKLMPRGYNSGCRHCGSTTGKEPWVFIYSLNPSVFATAPSPQLCLVSSNLQTSVLVSLQWGRGTDQALKKQEEVWESCCSVAQLRLTLGDSVDCSTPGFPTLHHLPELA